MLDENPERPPIKVHTRAHTNSATRRRWSDGAL